MKWETKSGFDSAHFETLEPRRLMSAAAIVEMPMPNLLQVQARPMVTDTITLGDSFGQVNFVDGFDAPAEDVKSIAISQAHQDAKMDADFAGIESTATFFAFTSVVGDKLFSQVKVSAAQPNTLRF